MQNIRKWIESEITNSTSGQTSFAPADAVVHSLLIQKFNGYLADALDRTGQLPLIPSLRAKIMRGRLDDAAETLRLTKEGGRGIAPQSEEEKLIGIELGLESARLAYFNGDYPASIQSATETLKFDPPLTTLLSLLQTRAMAFFELDEQKKAVRDLDFALSLESLLPRCNSLFYAKAGKLYVEARKRDVGYLSLQLDRLWKHSLLSKSLNGDRLLTLLRAEVLLKRLRHEDYSHDAFACFLVAKALGDQLYEGLALLDLRFCGEAGFEGFARLNLSPYLEKFTKLQSLFMQVETGYGLTASAQLIMDGRRRHSTEASTNLNSEMSKIFVSKRKLLFDLDSFEARSIQAESQIGLALLSLVRGPKSKEIFFREVWALGAFRPHLHDNAIRALLKKLRRSFNLKIKTESAGIRLDEVWLVP